MHGATHVTFGKLLRLPHVDEWSWSVTTAATAPRASRVTPSSKTAASEKADDDGAKHTALYDIRNSIAELKFYRERLFKER